MPMYMNDEIGLLKDIVVKLDSATLQYMVTGSMAMALYGMPRMTRDIDIVIQLADSDADMLIDLFKEEYCLEAEGIRRSISSRKMFNIIHYEQVLKIDFVVKKDEPYRVEEFGRRRQIKVDGQSIYVVSPEDLILSKLVWAKDSESELQHRDVQQLLAMSATSLDWEYLKFWAHTLAVDTLLEKDGTNV